MLFGLLQEKMTWKEHGSPKEKSLLPFWYCLQPHGLRYTTRPVGKRSVALRIVLITRLFTGWGLFLTPFRGHWWRPTFSTASPTEVSRLRRQVRRTNGQTRWLLAAHLLTSFTVSSPHVTPPPASSRPPGLCVRGWHATSLPFGSSIEYHTLIPPLSPFPRRPLRWAIIFILFSLDGSFAVVMYLQQKEVRTALAASASCGCTGAC
jgi:hypothetical protein